jgi:adenosylmethionine-8-amino-7-oxononanoate aminotransferase
MSESLVLRDAAVIWHPFTPQQTQQSPIAISYSRGAEVFDENGKSYIDAISSWWVITHGHAHPKIVAAVQQQVAQLPHVMFSGVTHEPAVRCAELLLQRAPHYSKVFYSDDGSTAVEVAIKMALQFWHNNGQTRNTIIAFENAYHGDTFGSMSVGARNVFTAAFERHLFQVKTIPVPVRGQEEKTINAFKTILQEENIAAFIVEPLVQGAGGMVMYSAMVLDELFELAAAHDVISIADEVMTGFGRTGTFFATDQCRRKPDIIALSKGLTGGFMPLGATLCTSRIHDTYKTDDRTKTFFHGHSFTGNPLACAAAVASLELFEEENTMQKVLQLEAVFQSWLPELSQLVGVNDVRIMGGIFAVEITPEEGPTGYLNPIAERALQFFPHRGVLLRPLGNVLYVIPPYCIQPNQLQIVKDTLIRFIKELQR